MPSERELTNLRATDELGSASAPHAESALVVMARNTAKHQVQDVIVDFCKGRGQSGQVVAGRAYRRI
eukprot:604913-Pleurochrysis_carterae.AAC.1